MTKNQHLSEIEEQLSSLIRLVKVHLLVNKDEITEAEYSRIDSILHRLKASAKTLRKIL